MEEESKEMLEELRKKMLIRLEKHRLNLELAIEQVEKATNLLEMFMALIGYVNNTNKIIESMEKAR